MVETNNQPRFLVRSRRSRSWRRYWTLPGILAALVVCLDLFTECETRIIIDFPHDQTLVVHMEMAPSRYAIISDGTCRYMNNTTDTDVFVFSGKTIQDMTAIIARQPHLVSRYAALVLHVGTDDISMTSESVKSILPRSALSAREVVQQAHGRVNRLKSAEELDQDYRMLLKRIKTVNPRAAILISSIIPRPSEYSATQARVDEVNDHLERLAEEVDDCTFLHSYKFFVDFEELSVIEELYADGLHLNEEGSRELSEYFLQELHNYRKD